MSDEPTNAVLATKMDGLRELFEERFKINDIAHFEVNAHLKTLNGQVAKNTRFRIRSGAYMAVIAVIVTALTSAIIPKIVDAIFK